MESAWVWICLHIEGVWEADGRHACFWGSGCGMICACWCWVWEACRWVCIACLQVLMVTCGCARCMHGHMSLGRSVCIACGVGPRLRKAWYAGALVALVECVGTLNEWILLVSVWEACGCFSSWLDAWTRRMSGFCLVWPFWEAFVCVRTLMGTSNE